MDLGSLNFNRIGNINIQKQNNKSKIPNFKGTDIIDFSQATKEKKQTINELKSVGFSFGEANELIKKYEKNEKFKELITGTTDFDDKWISAHNIEAIFDRNLTQAEAILYLEYDMDDYFIQHYDSGCVPIGYEESNPTAKDYEVGEATFLPTDLAKYIKKGFPIDVSGMILKGKLTEEEAERLIPFYNVSADNYQNKTNVQQAEYTIKLIRNNIEKIELWISEEKDNNGNLISGLERPLTKEEATTLITEDYMPNDTASINTFLELNKKYNFSPIDMAFNDFWGKTVEEVEAQLEKREKIRQERIKKQKSAPKKIETMDDFVNAVSAKLAYLDKENEKQFFEDIRQLDSKKFLKKLSLSQMKYDAMSSFSNKRELRQNNIKVMNSMSEELIDKLTRKDNGEAGKFALICDLLSSEKLEERVHNLEQFRINSPLLFEKMSKETMLDYLTGSNLHTTTKQTIEEFKNMQEAYMYGLPYEEYHSTPTIIEFPKKSE